MIHEPPNDEKPLSYIITKPEDVVNIVIDDRILLNVNSPSKDFLDFFRHHVSEIVSNVLYKLPEIQQMSIFLAHAIQVLTSKNKDIRNVMTEDENLLKVILDFPKHAVETSPVARGCYCKVLEQVIIMSDYDYLSKIKDGRTFLKSLLDITYFTSVFDFLMNFVSSLVYSIIRFLEEISFTDLLLEYAFAEKCQEQCLKIADTLTRQLPRNLPLVRPLQDPTTILKLLDLGFNRHSCAAMEVILSMHSQPHLLSRPMINSINNEYTRICNSILNTKKFDQFSVLVIYLLTSIVNDIYCPIENYVLAEPAKIDYSTKKCLPKTGNKEAENNSTENDTDSDLKKSPPKKISKEEILSKSSIIKKRVPKQRKSILNKMKLNLAEFSQSRHSLDPSEVLRVHQLIKLPNVSGGNDDDQESSNNGEIKIESEKSNNDFYNISRCNSIDDRHHYIDYNDNVDTLMSRRNRRLNVIRPRPASFSSCVQNEEGNFGLPIYDRTKDNDNEINRININHHMSDNLQSILNEERQKIFNDEIEKFKKACAKVDDGASSNKCDVGHGESRDQLGAVSEEDNHFGIIAEKHEEINHLDKIAEEHEESNKLDTITEETDQNAQLETIAEKPDDNQLETIAREPDENNSQLETIAEEPEEPEGNNNQLETIVKEPEENAQLETIAEEPEESNNQLETIEEEPEENNNQLETIAEEPEGNNNHLETITEEPEGNNNQLETIEEEPEENNNQLETIAEEPEGNNNHLETIAEEPEESNNHLEIIAEEPEENNNQLETIAEEPEGNNNHLETIAEEPEESNNHLEIIAEEPEENNNQLETIAEEPEGNNNHLETIAEEPEESNNHLEIIAEEPEGNNNQLETITEEQEENAQLETIAEEPYELNQLEAIAEEPDENAPLETIEEEPVSNNEQLEMIQEEPEIKIEIDDSDSDRNHPSSLSAEDTIAEGAKSPLDSLLEEHNKSHKSVKLIKNPPQQSGALPPKAFPKFMKHTRREYCGTPTAKDFIQEFSGSIFNNEHPPPPSLGTITEDPLSESISASSSLLSSISEDDPLELLPKMEANSAPSSNYSSPNRVILSTAPNLKLSTNKFSTSPISSALSPESKRLVEYQQSMNSKPPECPTPPAQSFSVFSSKQNQAQTPDKSFLKDDKNKKDTMINNSMSLPLQPLYSRRHSSPLNFIPRSIPFPQKSSSSSNSSSISSSSSKEDNQLKACRKKEGITSICSEPAIPSPRRFSHPAKKNVSVFNSDTDENEEKEAKEESNAKLAFPSFQYKINVQNANPSGMPNSPCLTLPLMKSNLYKSEAVFPPFSMFSGDRSRIRNSNPAVVFHRRSESLKSPISVDPKTGEKLTLLDFARQASPIKTTDDIDDCQAHKANNNALDDMFLNRSSFNNSQNGNINGGYGNDANNGFNNNFNENLNNNSNSTNSNVNNGFNNNSNNGFGGFNSNVNNGFNGFNNNSNNGFGGFNSNGFNGFNNNVSNGFNGFNNNSNNGFGGFNSNVSNSLGSSFGLGGFDLSSDMSRDKVGFPVIEEVDETSEAESVAQDSSNAAEEKEADSNDAGDVNDALAEGEIVERGHLDKEEVIRTMVFMIDAFFANRTNSFLHNAIIQIFTSLFDYTSIVSEIISISELPKKILNVYSNKDNVHASFWGQLHHMVEFIQSAPEVVPDDIRDEWDLYICNEYHREEEIIENDYGYPSE